MAAATIAALSSSLPDSSSDDDDGSEFDASGNGDETTNLVLSSKGPSLQAPFEWIPDEILGVILAALNYMDNKTLLVNVPQVCRRWREACKIVEGVHFDFMSWWTEKELLVSTLAGLPSHSGLCQRFPLVTHVNFGHMHGATDAHLEVLAGNCHSLTSISVFNCAVTIDGIVALGLAC